MKKAILVAASLVVGASAALAVGEIFRSTGSAEYVVKTSQSGNEITKTETRFFEQALYGDSARLFKVVERATFWTGLDGYKSESVIEAFSTKNALFDTKAWTLNLKGGDFKVLNDHLIQVTEAGCCDSPDLNNLIDAQTGKVTLTAMNGTTIELEVPNSQLESRYIAQIQDAQAPQQKGTRSYIGSLGYFTKSKLKSVARIYANLPQHWGADFYDLTPVLRNKDEYNARSQWSEMGKITLWNTDGSTDASAAFAGIGLKGTISYENKTETFSVVVSTDRFSTSKSKATSDLDIAFVHYN